MHGSGFLHRDVSPGNIIFDDHGNAFLSDFGIATALTANDSDENASEYSNLTKPGGFVGAAVYAPPESIERKLNSGYDQYSLGVVVYEALTGQLPFRRASSEAILVAKNTQAPAPITQHAPDLAPGIARAVMRAISRDPAARFQSSQAFAAAFAAGLEAQKAPPRPERRTLPPPSVRAARRPERTRKHPSKKGRLLGASALVLVLAAVGLETFLSLDQTGGAPEVARQAVAFEAGSSPAEMEEAYDLCVGHLGARGCDRSDYTDEVRRTGPIAPGVMDPHEVTNGEFADFVTRTQYQTIAEQRGTSWLGGFSARGLHWREPAHGESHSDRPDHPVVHVTRFDAQKYCKFHGKRLPTELEWEYAARGVERRIFPWGDTWIPTNASWQGQAAQRVEGPRRVGSHAAGRS